MIKVVLNNTLKLINSQKKYLIVGLIFFVVIVSVNAAVTINSGPVVSGEVLAVSRWNTMVGDLENTANEIAERGFFKVTSVCYGDQTPYCSYAANNYYLDIMCPSDFPVVVGGDCIYSDKAMTVYPSLGRSTSGEILNNSTFRCYFWHDGNARFKGVAYCSKF